MGVGEMVSPFLYPENFAFISYFSHILSLYLENLPVALFLPKVTVKVVVTISCVRFFVTPWTVARQVPLSMEFSRQEYWSGLAFPSQGDLPHPGIELRSSAFQADSLPSEPPGKPFPTQKLSLFWGLGYISFNIWCHCSTHYSFWTHLLPLYLIHPLVMVCCCGICLSFVPNF